MYYKLHKISLNRAGSFIVSPKWVKTKRATINSKTNDDKCLQYLITVALNHEQVKSHPEIISNFELSTDRYDWKERNFHKIKKAVMSLKKITK